MRLEPYYQDEWATIFHGDCREIAPLLGSFDLLLTDPPYGLCSYAAERLSQIVLPLFGSSTVAPETNQAGGAKE